MIRAHNCPFIVFVVMVIWIAGNVIGNKCPFMALHDVYGYMYGTRCITLIFKMHNDTNFNDPIGRCLKLKNGKPYTISTLDRGIPESKSWGPRTSIKMLNPMTITLYDHKPKGDRYEFDFNMTTFDKLKPEETIFKYVFDYDSRNETIDFNTILPETNGFDILDKKIYQFKDLIQYQGQFLCINIIKEPKNIKYELSDLYPCTMSDMDSWDSMLCIHDTYKDCYGVKKHICQYDAEKKLCLMKEAFKILQDNEPPYGQPCTKHETADYSKPCACDYRKMHCLNNGTMIISADNDYSCKCPPGWQGSICQDENNPCPECNENSGNCEDGKSCVTNNSGHDLPRPPQQRRNGNRALAIVSTVTLFLLIVAFGYYVFKEKKENWKKTQRYKRSPKSPSPAYKSPVSPRKPLRTVKASTTEGIFQSSKALEINIDT